MYSCMCGPFGLDADEPMSFNVVVPSCRSSPFRGRFHMESQLELFEPLRLITLFSFQEVDWGTHIPGTQQQYDHHFRAEGLAGA